MIVSADDTAVTAVAAAPQRVAEQNDWLPFRPTFVLDKQSAKLRLHSQHVEEIWRHPSHGNLRRVAVTGEVECIGIKSGQRLERLRPFVQELISQQGAVTILGLVANLQAYELLRIAVRKRPQEQRVSHGKDGGCRPNADGKQQDRAESESRSLPSTRRPNRKSRRKDCIASRL